MGTRVSLCYSISRRILGGIRGQLDSARLRIEHKRHVHALHGRERSNPRQLRAEHRRLETQCGGGRRLEAQCGRSPPRAFLDSRAQCGKIKQRWLRLKLVRRRGQSCKEDVVGKMIDRRKLMIAVKIFFSYCPGSGPTPVAPPPRALLESGKKG